MRRLRLLQLVLSAAPNEEEHLIARELREIDRALVQLPDNEILAMVHADLVGPGISVSKGRKGMTAEMVLRALIVKQLYGLTYRGLAYCLADSNGCRAFCRIAPGDKSPKRAALWSNIKRIKPETLEAINTKLLDLALERGVERGRKTRTDCTVVETNIHEPSDSSLLFDCVKVLVRLMTEARVLCPTIEFVDHSTRAKRRMLNIQYARRKRTRDDWYKDLIKVTAKTVRMAETAVEQLATATARKTRQHALEDLAKLPRSSREADLFIPMIVRLCFEIDRIDRKLTAEEEALLMSAQQTFEEFCQEKVNEGVELIVQLVKLASERLARPLTVAEVQGLSIQVGELGADLPRKNGHRSLLAERFSPARRARHRRPRSPG